MIASQWYASHRFPVRLAGTSAIFRSGVAEVAEARNDSD